MNRSRANPEDEFDLRECRFRSHACVRVCTGVLSAADCLWRSGVWWPGTKLFLDGKPQQVIDHLIKLAPLERLGQPEDVANTVAFLAGPDGGWINGQVLRANGGII